MHAPSGACYFLTMAKTKTLKYSETKGWTGGDSRTLYTVTDLRTGQQTVRPGWNLERVGPVVDIRIATQAEADAAGWPRGWTVA